MNPNGITVNTRILRNRLTGVQRYTIELLRRFPDPLREARPPFRMTGILNQAWEQMILPRMIGKDLLWSPANTGPWEVTHQVLTIHDLAPIEHPEWYRPAFAKYFGWLLGRLVNRVSRIISVSEFTRESLLRHTNVEATKVVVVPNGVSPHFFPRRPEEIEQARNAYGLRAPDYLLYLGSIEPRKNLPRLLRAWKLFRESSSQKVSLVIGGTPANPRAFRKVHLNDSMRDVLFLGHVEDRWIPALLSGAVAFVYPSLYEGFGFPPLEAMACGTPTLTSDCTSLREVVGDAALTVNPVDEGELAKGIEKIIVDEALRQGLRARGLERAKQYSWDRSAARTWEILHECR